MAKKHKKGKGKGGGKKKGHKKSSAAKPPSASEGSQPNETVTTENENVASVPKDVDAPTNGDNGKAEAPTTEPPTETSNGPPAETTSMSPPKDAAPATTQPEKVEEVKKEEVVEPKSDLPPGLEASLDLLTPSQQELAKSLCSPELGQAHLFENWSKPEATNAVKKEFMEQLETMDKAYPSGGLAGYISNARDLLEKSKKGVNPLEGWKPSVPAGQAFELGTKEYETVESDGMKELGRVGFVLVAGGLGERLGYGDIKIGLPTEMATETKYLQFYIEYILALQQKYAKKGTKLPLCIMTSGDTNAGTVKLLEDNKYFGMDKSQVTIVQQGQGVPALINNDAKIALDGYKILAKPHGHGDIHALLHTHNVAKDWVKKGIEWMVFFQDTNGLAFHTLPLAIGVSKKLDLVMNSLAVPRKAKQAIGGIAKLENEKTKETRTINVEYNQLDPLLRSSGYPDGDVNDEKTGFSPFPGNINQLLFKLKPYADTLERTKGVMPEFVNPKYKDTEKTIFKKPTRLECMMQDFPTVLTGDQTKKVGFTSIAADLCFSPVKNATADGAALQAKGTQPGTAASGEADHYCATRKILRSIGCKVDDAEAEIYSGIKVVLGPAVVLKANFCACPGEYKSKFPKPSDVKISPQSSLVVKGSGVTIESLDLDGALVIECEDGASGVIKNLVVKNAGWERVADESSKDEVIAMRGYHLEKKETKTIVFKKDGTIEGDYNPESAVQEKTEEKAEEVAEKTTTKSTPVSDKAPEKPVLSPNDAPQGFSLSEPSEEEAKQKQGNDCGCMIL